MIRSAVVKETWKINEVHTTIFTVSFEDNDTNDVNVWYRNVLETCHNLYRRPETISFNILEYK